MYFGDEAPKDEGDMDKKRKEFYNAPIASIYSPKKTFRNWFLDYNVVTAKGNKYVVKENAMLCVLDFRTIEKGNPKYKDAEDDTISRETYLRCMTAKDASKQKCSYTNRSFLEYPHLIRIAGVECKNDCESIPEDVETDFMELLKKNEKVPEYKGDVKQLQNWYSLILLSSMFKFSMNMISTTIEKNFVKSVFQGDDFREGKFIKFDSSKEQPFPFNPENDDIFALNGRGDDIFIKINKITERIIRLAEYYISFGIKKAFREEMYLLKNATFESIFLFYRFITPKIIYNIGLKFGKGVETLLTKIIYYTKIVVGEIKNELYFAYKNGYISAISSYIFKNVLNLLIGEVGINSIYDKNYHRRNDIANALKWAAENKMKMFYLSIFILSVSYCFYHQNLIINHPKWIRMFPHKIVDGVLHPEKLILPAGHNLQGDKLAKVNQFIKFINWASRSSGLAVISTGLALTFGLTLPVGILHLFFLVAQEENERERIRQQQQNLNTNITPST